MNSFFALAVAGAFLAYFAHPLLIFYYFGKRKNLTNHELVNTFNVSSNISDEALLKVLARFSDAYKIPIGKLRPSDLLVGPISRIDSWRLGCGADSLSSYYQGLSECTFSLPPQTSLNDLVLILASLEENARRADSIG